MTTEGLSNLLKEVWTEDTFKKAFETDMDSALMNYRNMIQRQVRFTGDTNVPEGHMYAMPIHLNMSPEAVRFRKQRQLELEQRVAKAKRGNKPSYRQRQRNARAANGHR